MQYHWISVLFFLTAVLLANIATTLEPWDDMQVKHTWHAVPVNWEGLGHPPAGTRINLHIALRPERESALIDAGFDTTAYDPPPFQRHRAAG
jgi:tripeptidyl-peptidase-1